MTTAFKKARRENIQQLQIDFLALNGYPHHLTQAPEFAKMFQLYDPEFRPIARETYVAGISAKFDKMIEGIKRLIVKVRGEMVGVDKWLSILHDMWTSANNNGIMGSSFKLTDKEMYSHTIAAILKKHNITHSAAQVGETLAQVYEERYGVSAKKEVKKVGSDTTPSAANVSESLDGEQEDCEMHVVALVINYASGWSENRKTETVWEVRFSRRF